MLCCFHAGLVGFAKTEVVFKLINGLLDWALKKGEGYLENMTMIYFNLDSCRRGPVWNRAVSECVRGGGGIGSSAAD